MKKKIAKELRRFSKQKLGPIPEPRRRNWIQRAWDWVRGREDRPVDYERLAYRNMKKQYRRWRRMATG